MTDEQLDALLRETLRAETPPEKGADCPTTDDLWDFLANTLPAAERERIDTHLATCNLCVSDVARLYRGLKGVEKKHRAELVVTHGVPLQSGWSAVFGGLFRRPAVRWGFAAAAVLILVLMWKLRLAPRRENFVRDNGSQRKPAPQTVRQPDENSPPLPQPQTTPREKKMMPQPPPPPRPQQKKPRPTLLVMSDLKMTDAEALLDEMRRLHGPSRNVEQTGEPSIAIVKPPHYTVVLSQTPELAAKASGITGPFTLQVDEGTIEGGAFQPVKEDIAGTKDKPVDTPSLTLPKPLGRGKVYRWQVSAGDKTASAVFMVAEQRTADAAKKYVHAPLLLAEFYKAHRLYQDAQSVLDERLKQRPDDAQARKMKKEIGDLLRGQ